MSVYEIVSVALTSFFAVALAIGALVGLSKGAARASVKLGANLLSVVIALVLAIITRDTVDSITLTVVNSLGLIPAETMEMIDSVGPEAYALVNSTLRAVETLICFSAYFFVIRLIMLIPQHIIAKRLPKRLKNKEIIEKKQRLVAAGGPRVEEVEINPAPDASYSSVPVITEDSPEAAEETSPEAPETLEEADIPAPVTVSEAEQDAPVNAEKPAPQSSSEPVYEEYEEKTVRKPNFGLKLLWGLGGALAGALSALIVVGVYLMPLSGIAARLGDTPTRVLEAFEATSGDMENDDDIKEVLSGVEEITGNILFKATDFVYGKTVYEPILTIKTEYGRINLVKEIDSLANTALGVVPPIMRLTEGGELRKQDTDAILEAADALAENELVMTLGSIGINAYGGKGLGINPEDSVAMTALKTELNGILKDINPETLGEDVGTIATLVETYANSELLTFIMDSMSKDETENPDGEEEGADALMDIISDEKFSDLLGETFAIAYDNRHLRALLVPAINFGTETLFTSMDVEPVYSTVDLSNYSRTDLVEEAERLCEALNQIILFAESATSENASISTYKFDAAGKALDCFKVSLFFGDSYTEICGAVSDLAKTGDEENDKFIDKVTDAITNSESAENLLGSAQSVVIIGEQLEQSKDSDKKGSENEALVGALETLGKNDSLKDRETLEKLAEEILEVEGNENVDENKQGEIINDCMKALNTVIESGKFDAAKEADAIQTIYDVSHSDAESFFSEPGKEEEMVENLANSEVAIELLETLNKDNKDYGINENITEENRNEIGKAVDSFNIDDSVKQTIKDFFNIKK